MVTERVNFYIVREDPGVTEIVKTSFDLRMRKTAHAVKKAEDNDHMIQRIYETAGVETYGTIRLLLRNRSIEATFQLSEIKTFRVPKDETQPVIKTDLLEM